MEAEWEQIEGKSLSGHIAEMNERLVGPATATPSN